MSFCSFCGSTPEGTVLIAFDEKVNAGICDTCIVLCGEVIANPTEKDIPEVSSKGESHCTFCGKNSQEVGVLIRGPAGKVYICRNCLKAAAASIISTLQNFQSTQKPNN
ncbi:MAG: ClpX C4-type zinc finger protein [Patescibacteria group bacterium]